MSPVNEITLLEKSSGSIPMKTNGKAFFIPGTQLKYKRWPFLGQKNNSPRLLHPPGKRGLKIPALLKLEHAVWTFLLKQKSFKYFKTKSLVTKEKMCLQTVLM